MRTSFVKVILLGFAVSLLSFDIPNGWIKAGSKPQSYEMGLVSDMKHDGKNVVTIQSIDKKIEGFGTFMQMCKADQYKGKRVKMTAFVKSEDVKSWAGLWLRVDQAKSTTPLAFDNMSERAIKGTSDWAKYEIVLDVPNNASELAFGALLDGTGKVWISNFNFEVVSTDVPLTGTVTQNAYNIADTPTNLDFGN